MSVQATDLKFYKSSASTTNANNTSGNLVGSIGGAISTTQITSGQLHDLFDAVLASEAQAGRIEYRCIYVVNSNTTPQTLYDARVFVQTNTVSADSSIEIALDPAAVGTDSTISLTDELDSDNKLSGLTFSPASDFDNGLVIGDVAGNGGKNAIWIKRTINAGASAANESAVIQFQGDTDY